MDWNACHAGHCLWRHWHVASLCDEGHSPCGPKGGRTDDLGCAVLHHLDAYPADYRQVCPRGPAGGQPWRGRHPGALRPAASPQEKVDLSAGPYGSRYLAGRRHHHACHHRDHGHRGFGERQSTSARPPHHPGHHHRRLLRAALRHGEHRQVVWWLHAAVVSPAGCGRHDQPRLLSAGDPGAQSLLCPAAAGDVARVVSRLGRGVSLYYGCGGALFRLGTLWQAKHHRELGLCQDDAHPQLSRAGSVDPLPCRRGGFGQSVLCHHASRLADLFHRDGYRGSHRGKPGPHQWHVLHLERGDEPRLLASDAHQASHSCQGPAVYPCGQYGHVYRCGADPPPLSRLLPHGGRLRTCHHHHDADDHLAPGLLPAPKGRVAHPLHGLCWQLLCHRGHLPGRQPLQVSCRRMVYVAHRGRSFLHDAGVGACQTYSPSAYLQQAAERLLSDHLRHQGRRSHTQVCLQPGLCQSYGKGEYRGRQTDLFHHQQAAEACRPLLAHQPGVCGCARYAGV